LAIVLDGVALPESYWQPVGLRLNDKAVAQVLSTKIVDRVVVDEIEAVK